MKIEDMTIGEVRQIIGEYTQVVALFGNHTIPTEPTEQGWEIGKTYLIRTVTMIDTGRVVAVTEHEIVLEDAAWIADTGRFSQALAAAEFSEVEPFPCGRVIVGRGSIIDAVQIKIAPRSQK